MLNAAYSCPSGIDCRHWSIKQVKFNVGITKCKQSLLTSTNIAQCNHLTVHLGMHKGSFLNGWSNSNISIPLNLLQQYLLPAPERLFCRRFCGLFVCLLQKYGFVIFCMQFVQLILRKVVETVEDKMHQIRFRLQFCPRLQWRSYSVLRDALAGFQGSYLQGEGG